LAFSKRCEYYEHSITETRIRVWVQYNVQKDHRIRSDCTIRDDVDMLRSSAHSNAGGHQGELFSLSILG
jgi:hypothetical protein